MKIELILDKTKKISTKGYPVFNTEKEYFNAYTLLQKAIKDKIDKTIIVYNKPLQKWLLKGLKKYPNVQINAIELTFRDLLAKKWKVTFDINMTDTEIVRDNLLDLQIEGVQEQTLSNFIADNFISLHLNTEALNKSKFGELLNDLLKFEEDKLEYPQIAKTILRIKINKWLKNSPENSKVIQSLIGDIKGFYNLCCSYNLIKNYPENFQTKCLEKKWLHLLKKSNLSLLKLNINSFTSNNELFQPIKDEFELFFEGVYKSIKDLDGETIIDLLSYFSGELPIEIEFLIKILEENPGLISNKLILKIKNVFRPILTLYGQQINSLKDYKQPAIPTPFNNNWDLQETIDWALKKYLPYKFWLENCQRSNPEINKYGYQFAEYIFNNYEKFSYHYKNVIYRFIYNNKNIIKNTEIPILVILDNFNYKFINRLRDSFTKYEIVPKNIIPYLGILPTETSIAKIAIVAGKRDIAEVSNNYRKTIMSVWQEYFPEHKIQYVSKAGVLDEHKPKGKEFIIINYTQIDSELHKSYEKTAIEHKRMVSFIIDEFARNISRFIKRNNLETKSKIFFISDHGSTLITSDVLNNVDINLFKKYDIDLSHRFFATTDKKFASYKDNPNISDSIFCLNKEIAGSKKNYIIARGYNHFKNINESFYVHGGATPEEIIVPGGYFEYNTEFAKKIILQLTKQEYRLKAKETVKIRIANPNNLIINNLIFNIYNKNSHLSEIILDELRGKSEKNISGDIRIPSREVNNFLIKLDYEITGKLYEMEKEFSIKLKTITQPKIDLNKF